MNPPELISKWQHVIEAVGAANRWDTHAELAWICEAASNVPADGHYLEIGAYWGASTKAAALANPTLHVTVLDAWHDEGCYERFLETTREFSDRITVFIGLTEETLPKLKEGGRHVDFAFLDAGHIYEHVAPDILNTLPLMNHGGLMAGHDFRIDNPDDGVTRAVRELVPQFALEVDTIWSYKVP